MKNKSMLVVILMGSILSFLPQVLWAGGRGEKILRALEKYEAQQAKITSKLQRLNGAPSTFPKWSVPLPPTIRFGDFELTCETQASREYDACLEEKEGQCGEELQTYMPTPARAPYLVCPSNEEITDLPCRELQSDSLEICTCRQKADDRYEGCLQSPESSASCENARFGDYQRCSSSRQLLDTQVQ